MVKSCLKKFWTLKYGFALTILLACFGSVMAQPEAELLRLYDGGQPIYERFEDVYQRAAGGYYLCGKSNGRLWLICTDENGGPMWSSTRGDVAGRNGWMADVYSTVIETDDGDALVGGKRAGRFNVALRTQNDGEDIWNRDYGSGWCQSVIELKGGNFALAGGVSGHAKLIMIEPNGEIIWQFDFQNENNITWFHAIRETDGGVVAVGDIGQDDFHFSKAALVKVDFDGNIIWSRIFDYGERSIHHVSSLVSRQEGGFTFGRTSQSSEFALTRVDERGENVIDRTFPTNESVAQRFACLNRLSDGGYVMVGGACLLDEFPLYSHYQVTRTDRNGRLIWNTYLDDLIGGGWPGGPNNGNEYYQLRSVIVEDNDRIVTCGEFYNTEGEPQSDAILLRFFPDALAPFIFYRFPEDSIINVLPDTTIRFIVRARSREGFDLAYRWFSGEDSLSTDTTESLTFDSIGDYSVRCRVRAQDWQTWVNWTIHARDFFIVSHSPDSLNLTLRRGATIDFVIDSVAAVEGDPVQYQWTLTNIDNFEREDAGEDARTAIDFLRGGNFQLEGLAYRGESSDNVIWTIQVRSAILDFWPRSLNLTVLPDSLVNFGVLPFNPASDSLSYAWYLNNNLIGLDSTMQWRFAPGDQGDSTSYNFSVIVMDGSEGDTVRWVVNVHPPEGVGKWTIGQVNKWGILSISPNPFNNSTTIRFTVPSASTSTSMTLHDLTGREVQNLIDAPLAAGKHSVTLNGADLPAGIYLLKLVTGDSKKVVKVALVR